MYKSLIVVLVVLCCSFAPASNLDQMVIAAAESQLPVFLSKIPAGHEQWYGFTADDDLDLLTIGKPYRILMFTTDFYANPPSEDRNYFSIKNEWLAPVLSKGEVRNLLTMNGNPGNYVIASMGDTTLAKDLVEQSKDANENDEYYVLRIPRLRADFFVTETNNSFSEARFTPLLNAIVKIPALTKTSKTSFSLLEVEKVVKDALAKLDR